MRAVQMVECIALLRPPYVTVEEVTSLLCTSIPHNKVARTLPPLACPLHNRAMLRTWYESCR